MLYSLLLSFRESSASLQPDDSLEHNSVPENQLRWRVIAQEGSEV